MALGSLVSDRRAPAATRLAAGWAGDGRDRGGVGTITLALQARPKCNEVARVVRTMDHAMTVRA
jgi:hypothetical protein